MLKELLNVCVRKKYIGCTNNSRPPKGEDGHHRDIRVTSITAVEMYVYRHMHKISYCDHITNSEVQNRISKEAELQCTIQERWLKYFGRVYKQPDKYRLIHNVGKKKPVRRRMSWMGDLRK